ncbi:MAG: Do family serine endopeptidase [Pseudomonadota bacterium]|nr:Do family serine endopeptidase [Pseudomonadota bacterium]
MSKSNSADRGSVLRAFALGAASAGAIAVAAVGLTAEAQAPRLLSPPLAADGTLSFADLVERVSPAVVSVLVEKKVETPQLPSQLENFFQFRFGAPDQGDGFGDGSPFGSEPQTMEAQGSGFFIDADGHVVTNNHVIENADRIEVRLADGKTVKATLVGADPLTDLAVLKVEAPKGQAYVQFADDVNLRVGDWVVAVGNPFGLSGTVTSGIVSAIGGQGRDAQFLDFIQIDAPINRGNSGGPTFDLKGRVVGVNTAIYSTTGGSVGIGFAIPAKVARETTDQLIKNGSVTRGWLGVSIQPVTTEIAAALGRKEAKGALVAEVIDNTPAAKAGLLSGDLILAVNGKDIADPRDLTRTVSALPPGEKARVKVLRSGAEKTLNVTLGARGDVDAANGAPSDEPKGAEDSLSTDLGLRVSELSPTLRQQFRLPDGVSGLVVTGVKHGSPADQAGLRSGAVILDVDGKAATSTGALKKTVEDAKKAGKEAVLLRYQVGELKQFGALTLKKAG